jgi:hypothetical protein
MLTLRGAVVLIATSAGVLAAAAVPGAAGAAAPVPQYVQQIDRQDIAPSPGSEPDTLVEPDVAVSPLDPNIAVAAAHDGRYPDGGAVDIGYSWTHNGGKTWHHAPVPGITTSAGGVWDRASDPVLAFGPDGSAYLSVLAFDNGCSSAVTVSRSTDGGKTFGVPVVVHRSDDCNYSDDKNFLVVDNGSHSPHYGRLYQFWTPFLADTNGNATGSIQVVRWSDDHGQTWSNTVNITPDGRYSQNSQPMVQPNGNLIDAYLDYGPANHGEGAEAQGVGNNAALIPATTTQPFADRLAARRSTNGGATWSVDYTITRMAGEGPDGIRCCLPSATADPTTGTLYATWISPDSTAVMMSQSPDGHHWSAAVQVTPAGTGEYINVDVAAYGGTVFLADSLRLSPVGHFVQQQLTSSPDGSHFSAPIALGPLSDLRYAAVVDGGFTFPGDYMGTAATAGRLYVVWCRSTQPAAGGGPYHQVVYGAALTT